MERQGLRGSVVVASIGLALSACIGAANAQETGNRVILTPDAPKPIGPYSQAIQVGNAVYLAGQVAIDPKSNQPMTSASIEDQTRQVLEKS